MNINLLSEMINLYKENLKRIRFGKINEIYKWEAIRKFQIEWYKSHDNIYEKLEISTKLVSNLMDSSNQYLPRTNILKLAKLEPDKITYLFTDLFNENFTLRDRIKVFRDGIKKLNAKYEVSNNKYASQDLRAVMVYLSLRFPDTHYFYKYGMYKNFADLIDYHTKPKKGKIQDVIDFESMCDEVKKFLKKDDELINLHFENLNGNTHIDTSLNILTQDFIYACVKHIDIDKIDFPDKVTYDISTVENTKIVNEFNKKKASISKIDYIKRHIRNTEIGLSGENAVMKYEQNKLLELEKNIKKLSHVSLKNDGLGYDIESLDKNGNKIYIEVKTTTSGLSTPFFITQNH